MRENETTSELLDELKVRFQKLEKEASKNKRREYFHIDNVKETVRKNRTFQNLTIQELADLSGTSYGSVSKVERGDTSTGQGIVAKLSHVSGLKYCFWTIGRESCF